MGEFRNRSLRHFEKIMKRKLRLSKTASNDAIAVGLGIGILNKLPCEKSFL